MATVQGDFGTVEIDELFGLCGPDEQVGSPELFHRISLVRRRGRALEVLRTVGVARDADGLATEGLDQPGEPHHRGTSTRQGSSASLRCVALDGKKLPTSSRRGTSPLVVMPSASSRMRAALGPDTLEPKRCAPFGSSATTRTMIRRPSSAREPNSAIELV